MRILIYAIVEKLKNPKLIQAKHLCYFVRIAEIPSVEWIDHSMCFLLIICQIDVLHCPV
jgi:hypothetical protein